MGPEKEGKHWFAEQHNPNRLTYGDSKKEEKVGDLDACLLPQQITAN